MLISGILQIFKIICSKIKYHGLKTSASEKKRTANEKIMLSDILYEKFPMNAKKIYIYMFKEHCLNDMVSYQG